jgi:hypothetical protein
MKVLETSLNNFSQTENMTNEEKLELRNRFKSDKERISAQEKMNKYMQMHMDDI